MDENIQDKIARTHEVENYKQLVLKYWYPMVNEQIEFLLEHKDNVLEDGSDEYEKHANKYIEVVSLIKQYGEKNNLFTR